MHVIANTRLFKELQEIAESGADDVEIWQGLFDFEDPKCRRNEGAKDPGIPDFAGGLDHVEVTEKRIVFHDRGCIYPGFRGYVDRSFVVVPEKKDREARKLLDKEKEA